MSNALVLDILFVVFLLLFALIGFWRGIVKEGMATGGILFGALLADNWSARFGAIGSNLLNITANASRFLTIEALILAFALVIGYGSGSLLAPPVRGLGARLCGAVFGAVNGAFLLAFSLAAAHAFIGRASTQRLLVDSRISRLLIQRFNWFLLVVVAIILVLLFGRLVMERETRFEAAAPDYDRERRAARLPAPGEDRKLEPRERGFNEEGKHFRTDASALHDLAPMPPVSRAQISEDRAFLPVGEHAGVDDELTWRTIRFSRDETAPLRVPHASRCANCGERVSNNDAYCPGCGQPVKKEETHDTDA